MFTERHQNWLQLFFSKCPGGMQSGAPLLHPRSRPPVIWVRQRRERGRPGAGMTGRMCCPLPCSAPPNMSMPSDAWSTATPGGRLLARPGAHRLILEMTCRLSCCHHIGAEGGCGEDGEEQAGKGMWVGVFLTFLLRPCRPDLVGSLRCHPGRSLGPGWFS